MTRNRYIDLDVERAGIGRWVEPGDIEGWVEAMCWFDRHPDESVAMGLRARALVDEGPWNSLAFARGIDALLAALGTPQRRRATETTAA
jgi:hypothetical protein